MRLPLAAADWIKGRARRGASEADEWDLHT